MNEEENVQNTDFWDATPDINQEQTADIDNTEEQTDTPDGETEEYEDVARDTEYSKAQDSVSENKAEPEPFVSVQYNHKNRDFTKDEAIEYIQKGMHTESLRNKLEYAASIQGVDVNTLVERIISAPENTHRAYLEDLYGKGSKEVEIGMDIYRQSQSEAYKKIIAERENSIEMKNKEAEIKSVNSRLADEYIMLKTQMPEAPEYAALPDSVIIEAAEGKRDLYSAYLCYLHKEKQKIEAAQKAETAARSASTGAMKSGGDSLSSADRNFLSGLWDK